MSVVSRVVAGEFTHNGERQMMKRMRYPQLAAAILCLLSTSCYAEEPVLPPYDMTQFFYSIGSGTGIREVGGVEVPTNLMLRRDFAMMFGSGVFDPVYSIKQTLNNIQNEVESKLVGIGTEITASISALPGYIFCRANPLACQLHENYTTRAEEKSKVAVKYLEDMEQQVAKSRDHLEGWFQAAKANHLVTAMNTAAARGEQDLEKVVDEVRRFSGKEGLKWLGGEFAGGDSQPPIRPIADTAKAGFNMLLGKPVTNKLAVTGTDPMLSIWDTPEEAGQWIAEVVGEFRPDINNNVMQRTAGMLTQGSDDGDSGLGGEDVLLTRQFLEQDVSTPALGLTGKVRKESQTIQQKLRTLSALSGMPTAEQVTQIMGESGNSVIPRDLFNILRSSKIEGALIRRIAEDIAISNVIGYALEARRVLIAGRNEPHIGSYQVAQQEIAQKIAILEKDIEMLMFERKVSQSLLSETIGKIYQYSDDQLRNSRLIPNPSSAKRLGYGVAQ